ncbi:MAG: dipeptide ABC transporter ATP-binding protein [Proteobacteria bacterium]|nr:dipeptide ABC transporter ATP-binding protein [Pseudomonadota bacterium]
MNPNQPGGPLLEVKHLTKWFNVGKGLFSKPKYVKAVEGVSFFLEKGKTIGVVGESGCGKSTLARLIMQLIPLDSGQIIFRGDDITGVKGKTLKNVRKNMQMIFQDSYASLNPRMRIGNIIAEPLIIHGEGSSRERKERVEQILEIVGLSKKSFYKFPHEFSGGQRQRIDIARALVFNPDVVICDEAVSALDVSVQAQVLNLLKDLQVRLDLSYVFISHDLSVVRHICDTIMVMYLGKTVETADKHDLFNEPLHPYTQALLSASPRPDPEAVSRQIILSGEVPSPMNPPSGCYFHTRCPLADDLCKTKIPDLKEVAQGHFVACHQVSKEKRPRLTPEG